MIIRDIQYNITNIKYSVHYKNRRFKHVIIQCFTFNCFKLVIIFHNHRKIPLYKKLYNKGNIAFLKYLANIKEK